MLVFGALHKHAHGFSGATASPHQEVRGLHALPWSLVVALIIAGALFTIAAVAWQMRPSIASSSRFRLCRRMLAMMNKLRSLLHGPLCYLAVLALCIGEAQVQLLANATLLLLCCGFHMRMKYCRTLSAMIAWALSSYAGFAACVVATCVCVMLPAFPARQHDDDVVASGTEAQQQQQSEQ